MTNSLVRIFLVEDDAHDARLVLAVLEKLKLAPQICVVSDGVAALDFLYARGSYRNRPPGNPAVVILDLKLPRLDGFEVLHQMRNDPALKFIPVVVLSSSSRDSDLRRAYELGANGYVVKTIDFEATRASLEALGAFWAVVNEPPPGSLRRPRSPAKE
ncbi:MAG: response regulator [Pirellulaceae bacterium]